MSELLSEIKESDKFYSELLDDVEFKDVESSNLNKVGYSDAHACIIVEFKNGQRFAYIDQSEDDFSELIEADSVGSYFSRNIRRHDYYKLLGES